MEDRERQGEGQDGSHGVLLTSHHILGRSSDSYVWAVCWEATVQRSRVKAALASPESGLYFISGHPEPQLPTLRTGTMSSRLSASSSSRELSELWGAGGS